MHSASRAHSSQCGPILITDHVQEAKRLRAIREWFSRHSSDAWFHESGQQLVRLRSRMHEAFSTTDSAIRFPDCWNCEKTSVSDQLETSPPLQAMIAVIRPPHRKSCCRPDYDRVFDLAVGSRAATRRGGRVNGAIATQSTQTTGLPALSPDLSTKN